MLCSMSVMSLKASSSVNLFFKLSYKSLEGYANLLGRKVEKQTAVRSAEYRFRGCVFNNVSKRFEGRFHDSMPCRLVESLQTGAVICPIEQVVFFYCGQIDPTLILVVQLIAVFHSDSTEHKICLGWSMLPLFDHRGNVSRVGKSPSPDTVRLALYEGSPRALFSLSHPTGDTKHLVPIPGCILTCSLTPHPTLSKASHLFPPNTLLSMDDPVPGLIPTKALEAFPKLLKTSSGSFEKVSLLLLPSVDDFEEHLLSSLSEDLNAGGTGTSTTSAVTIEERRLKVQLYNGWSVTGSPVIGYLERGVPATGKLSGSLRGSTYGLRGSLVLKGSLEVSDFILHANTEVILQLEYIISWTKAAIFEVTAHDSTSRRNSSLKFTDKPPTTHSTTLTLAWAVWQPFKTTSTWSESELSTPVSLELKQGLGYRPTTVPSSANSACYQNNLGDAGKVTFKFISAKPPSRVDEFNTASVVQFEDQLQRSPRRSVGRDMPDSSLPLSPPPDDQPDTHTTTSVVTQLRKPHPQIKGQPPTEEGDIIPEHLHSVEVISEPEQIASTTAPNRSVPISRSILAYLHNAGLEDFKDKKGDSLPTVHSKSAESASLSSDDLLTDGPLQIAIQLMGCSFSPSSSRQSLILTVHCSLFPLATFHCSCTPPPENPAHMPHLLSPLDSDGSQFGVTHCYDVNHLTLPTKTDRSQFTSLLATGHLIIDVYDRDSLFLLGTAHAPLSTLSSSLTNSPPSHCQSALSLPLLLPTHTTDTAITTLTLSHITPTHVTSSTPSQLGTLYVRLARLPSEPSRTVNLENPETVSKRMPRIARRLYGDHTHLGAGQQRNNEDEETRKRKLARMQKVREMRAKQNGVRLFHTPVPLSDNQANIIDIQREELKRERIASVLEDSISTGYLLRPRLGRAVYFEHPYTNTHTQPLTVSLSWKEPELKLVVDRRENECLRQYFSIHTAMDDSLISEGPEAGQYGFFVYPGETVHVPFKYQTFTPSHQTSSGSRFNGVVNETTGEQHNRGNKTIKVYLQANQEVVAILNVQVDPLPPSLNKVLHFYHPERTFFKKQLSLSPSTREGEISGHGQVFVCCSEPEVLCEVKHSNERKRSIFIKAPVQASPSLDTLYIMIYYDQKYLVTPSEVWRIHIHSAHRMDHSLQIGQSSKVKLMLRGTHTDRRVSCYLYNPPNIKALTPSPFLLSSDSLTEFPVTLKTLTPGKSNLLISSVDVDSQTAVQRWTICSESHPPTISRGFQISLPIGGGTLIRKTISFTNPYSKKRSFHLSTSRPDVVEFDNVHLKLQAQETTVLNLNFSPQQSPVTISVYIFINDSTDLTEESFLVKTVYC